MLRGRRAKQAGKSRSKGWFHRFLDGIAPQRGKPGKFALKEWMQKRVGFGDRYLETVIDEETGELIKHVDELLSEHTRHGSAKA